MYVIYKHHQTYSMLLTKQKHF